MIKVTGNPIVQANEKGVEWRQRLYTNPEGLECKEFKKLQYESDFINGTYYRLSSDNGKTWGEWIEKDQEEYSKMYGEDEFMTDHTIDVWNPVHKHYVRTFFTRFCLEGHTKAYENEWKGIHSYFDHQYLELRRPDEDEYFSRRFVKYEDGDDFDPQNPRNPEYLYKNRGYLNPPTVLKNGDIAVPVSISIRKGCELAGLDPNKIAPNSADREAAVLIARGRYNPEKECYDLTFSNPVILTDRQSSRGIAEPAIAELNSGRIVLVMRASNVIYEEWHSLMEPNTPGFKWYAFSDDGGKTFSEAMPWHFDNQEVIYSPASISEFIRSSKTGKLYWIGNITDCNVSGNFPRYPLNIVEIDEQSGLAKRETLTTIDTRREGEPSMVQLSNFCLIEDRETLDFELTLIKYAQFDNQKPFYGETWLYKITVEN